MSTGDNSTERQYTNGKITVAWKPDVCQHSTICWKDLLPVFNLRNRLWINMQGADSESIKNQMKRCQSGAFTYFVNKESLGL